MDTIITNRRLTSLIEEKLSEMDLPAQPVSLYDPIRYTLSLGGKRIRPYLTLAGCGICGGVVEQAIPAALAVELLHNFTLLHDDIMDRAETRRGQPSVYKKWDASTAILSGDVMFVHAFDQLRFYNAHDKYSEIIDIFIESTRSICEGQAYDLEFESKEEVSVEEYLEMTKGKTAALIRGALILGGAVAESDHEVMDHLSSLGTEMGLAFQIQDDLLDVTADPDKFGKRKGGDIAEGKKTYLTILALDRGDRKQSDFVKDVLTKEHVSGREIEKMIELYRSLDIIKDTKKAIDHYYDEALSHLRNLDKNEYRNQLDSYIKSIKNRES